MPATCAAPTTSTAEGPTPLRLRFFFGAARPGFACGGACVRGSGSEAHSPRALAAIRLGFSFRRKSASAWSSSESHSPIPSPRPAALRASACSFAAPCSTIRSAFVISSWAAARRWRRARSWMPSAAPREWRRRPAPRRGRSRGAFVALLFACLTLSRPNVAYCTTRCAALDAAAADVPNRALRLYRPRVRERPKHANHSADSFAVEPLQAAPCHLGRGAVAEPPGDAETEARLAPVAGRICGRQQEGGAFEIVAREELELGVDIAPVLRESGELCIPGRDERARLQRGRFGFLADRPQLQAADDPLSVEAGQQPADAPRRGAGASAGGEERDHLPAPARVDGAEQRRGAVAVGVVLDVKPKPRVVPALRKHALDRLPLLDETHRADNKLTGVAKVERKSTLSEQRLRTFLREMLLIRRFEEKVEERFRAGELPGFLHVSIVQEAVAVGVSQALDVGHVFTSSPRPHGFTLARGTHPNAI